MLYNDDFNNYKKYNIPKAQLIITDIPYGLKNDIWSSHRKYYVDGNIYAKPSKNAKQLAFSTDDGSFDIDKYFSACSDILKEEPEDSGSEAPCVITFCAFEQMAELIEIAQEHGFAKYIPLFFVKNYSPQVLKANMKIVNATEYAILFYRKKLPKFRNGVERDSTGKTIPNTGHMVFNWFSYKKDPKYIPHIHPTQKPVNVIKQLLQVCTDPDDVVVDLCAGSGSTGRACIETKREFYGFEIEKEFYDKAMEKMLVTDGQLTLPFF